MATLQEAQAILKVLESGKYILGENVRLFEQEAAAYLGVGHAVGVGNGTDALVIALRAIGIGPGKKVAVPAFSFIASASSVELVGAEPVFVDVKDDYTIDPQQIPAGVDAIMAVHLYGKPCDMDALLSFGVPVVEDNAQAFGAVYRHKRTGSIGTIAAHSFYPTKNLPAVGDGGMVTTNDPDLARTVRMLRTHGWERKYYREMLGYNSRLDEIQAAVLRCRLPQLNTLWRSGKAQYLIGRYHHLGRVPALDWTLDLTHSYNLFTILCRDREQARLEIEADGHRTGIYYPVPLAPLPKASEFSKRVLSILL